MSNVPKLRFSEFGGEWEEKKLDNLTNKISDGIHTTPNYDDNGNFYFVNGNNLVDGVIKIDEKTKRVNESEYIKHKRDLNQNTILLSINGTIGNISFYNNENIVLGKSACYINVDDKLLDKYFIYNQFKTKSVLNFFYSEITGSTIKNLSLTTIKNTKIKLPSKPEQEKIASFLTSVDTKIEQLTKKETLLQEYKKGVMNKIFNQEIRFKDDDGSDFPEWEEKKLGDITKIIMGQSPSSDSYNLDNNGIPLIQGNADIQNRLTNPRNYTTEKTKECKVEDLILTVRAPVGAVAKSIHNACIGRGVCAIRNNKESVNEFIYQFLLNYETKWSSLEQGSTFTAVSGLEIKKLKLNLPSLKEQTKIANFLSSIDKKIELTTKELNSTKEFKKALLQQMFV